MADKKQTITTTWITKEQGKSPVQVARNISDALKNASKAQTDWSKLQKGSTDRVKLAKSAFEDYVGVVKKVNSANNNLSLVSLKLVKNFKAQEQASTKLQKTHAVAIQTNQRRTMSLQKAEAVAHQLHQKFLAREAKKIATLHKTEAQARAINNKMIANEKRKAALITNTNKDFASSTQTAVQKAILSWQSFERVILVHVIRRAFHMLMSTVRESITRIQEFHTAIVEIRTISQTMPASVNQWAESLERVSNAWSIDLIDAANARYQILSNQIAKGVVQTERFSEATFAFAKITKATAEESVNVLTAAMNAYGSTAEEVTRVSAILFKLVEFGRVRITEISESLGRASVPAAQLGISLEELAATIATITIKGVKATEAMTLIRGIVMKLNKPTGEMSDLFKRLGVSSGEALIEIHGLAGTLKVLQEETKGSSSEIAQLFGRIRPTMGISALLSDLEGFQDVLGQFGDQAVIDYMDALNDQFQTSGEKVKKAFNEVKNLIFIGLGKTASETIVNITDVFKTFEEGIDGSKVEISGLVNVVKGLILAGKLIIPVLIAKLVVINKLVPAVRAFATTIQLVIATMRTATTTATALKFAYTSMLATVVPLAAALLVTFAVGRLIRYRMEINAVKRDLDAMLAATAKANASQSAFRSLREQVSPNASAFSANIKSGLKGLAGGVSDPGVMSIPTESSDIEAIMKTLEERQKEALSNFKTHATVVASTVKSMYAS